MPMSAQATDFTVNGTTSSHQDGSDAAVLADGRIVVVWKSTQSDAGNIMGRLYNPDGSASGNEFVVNSTTTGEQKQPQVVALPDGRFYVAWTSNDGLGSDTSGLAIRGAFFDPGNLGSAPSDQVINTTGTSGDQTKPTLGVLSDGNVLVAWHSSAGPSIVGRVVSAAGTPIGSEITYVSSAASSDVPELAVLDGDRIVLARVAGLSIGAARVFELNGTPVESSFGAHTVTALKNGNFIAASLASTDGTYEDVTLQIYNADGVPVGAPVVAGQANQNDSQPTIAELADGRMLVAWADPLSPGGFKAQLLTADLSLIGGPFSIHTTSSSGIYNPNIIALDDGRFMMTWDSINFDFDVRARIFDPTIFNGTSGADTWTGGNLTDNIYGGAGNDTFTGGGGDDFLSGDAGNDEIDGDDGDDKLFGGADHDLLFGDGGKDSVYGGAGDDVLYLYEVDGDAAGEIYSGGSGVDTLRFGWADSDAYFDMRAAQIESIEFIDFGTTSQHGSGGGYVDVAITAAQASALEFVYGSNFGQEAEEQSADILEIHMDGQSTINLSNVQVDFMGTEDFFAVFGNTAATNNITGFKAVSNILVGGSANDTLTGGDNFDRIEGGAGADEQHGGDTYDYFFVMGNDAAGDSFYGGDGFDSVVASHWDYTSAAVHTVDLTGAAVFNSIEEFAFAWTDAQASVATMKFNASQLTGTSYNFYGSTDNLDTDIVQIIMGSTTVLNLASITVQNFDGPGDRFVIVSGLGNDTITGSAALDIVDYSARGAVALNIVLNDLGNGTGKVGAETDTLFGIDGAIGSNGNNVMTGGSTANFFSGGGGKDTIKSGAGNDTLKGGIGNDSLDGGLGNDTADYTDKTANVVLTLDKTGKGTAKIGAETDNLLAIENALGGTGNDTFTGSDPANVFNGGAGNDTLNGGLGNDTLTGGLGADRFVFSTAPNLALTNVDTITDFEHGIDKFAVSAKGLKGLPKAWTSTAFNSGAGMIAAQDPTDRLIYNTSTGDLYFDGDGLGGKVGAILIARLTAAPIFDSSDIIIV